MPREGAAPGRRHPDAALPAGLFPVRHRKPISDPTQQQSANCPRGMTVSAGAYSAGVMDFLIEAMDAWCAERSRQIEQFGDRYDQWTIPPHELQLAVMAGASPRIV